MRRGRTLIFIFLILIIVGAIGFIVYSQFSVPAESSQPVSVEIYITIQPIPQGGEITRESLSTIEIIPKNLATAMYTIDEQELLLGKTAKFSLGQGVVITESMVGNVLAAKQVSNPQWALLIPSGMTAISIPTDRLNLTGYGVNNGAHVNINACFFMVDVDPMFQSILPNLTAALTGTGFGNVTTSDGSKAEGLPILSLGVSASDSVQGRVESDPSLEQPFYVIPSETRQHPRMVCNMLLQDVVVLQVGNFPLDSAISVAATPAPPTDTNPQASPAAIVRPDIVTLIVSPQDSVTLSYLIFTGIELKLILRNPGDQPLQPTEALTLQFLLSQYNIPIPGKLPNALEPTLLLQQDNRPIAIPVPLD